MEISWQGPGYVVVTPDTTAGDGGDEAGFRTALLQAFAEDDLAVVCDLGAAGSGARDRLVAVAAAVARSVAAWPAALLVLVTGEGVTGEGVTGEGVARPLGGGVPPGVRTVRDRAAAEALVAARPVPRRSRRRLEPLLEAPALARAFLRETLAAWGDGSHLDDALVVVDELVANAVLHAGTDIELRLASLDGSLGIGVADRSPHRPELGHPGGGAESGRGLLLVDALTDAWHVLPRLDGGKVVRAVLRAPDGDDVRGQRSRERARPAEGSAQLPR